MLETNNYYYDVSLIHEHCDKSIDSLLFEGIIVVGLLGIGIAVLIGVLVGVVIYCAMHCKVMTGTLFVPYHK